METRKKIRKKRESLDFTQDYMGHRLGISQTAYAKIEAGKTKITIDLLDKTSEILGVNAIDLLENKAEKNIFHVNGKNSQNGNITNEAGYFQMQVLNKILEEQFIMLQKIHEKHHQDVEKAYEQRFSQLTSYFENLISKNPK